MAVPLRKCIGCSKIHPKSKLLRFVADGNLLRQEGFGKGRGAYLCKDIKCIERVLKNKGIFSRVLKVAITMPSKETLVNWISTSK
ncbi:MAG: YlxR family protein [Deltaproteobacteria bacterium]|nr:YlxR family protein [Deltaproteobacteria bacterium]